MGEPRRNINTADSLAQVRMDRAKSLHEIGDQYSRISNRLYRRYLDYEIDTDDFDRRRKQINDAFDRYEVNIMRTEVPGWKRGDAFPYPFSLYNKPISRSVYAKRNNRS